MRRGRTSKGRARALSLTAHIPKGRPLMRTQDHGSPVSIEGNIIGSAGDHWIKPFLAANAQGFKRLALRPEISLSPDPCVKLHPNHCIGAMPLLNPATRRVTAGILVEPRFRWPALGAVFNAIGFSVEPNLGGTSLVPGSAREVPPWILAGPVIERIEAMLRHCKRGFIEIEADKASPRGHIQWNKWIGENLPSGNWACFPCRFTEPDNDPELLAGARWTLKRLKEELSTVAWTLPARYLLKRANELQSVLGMGLAHRPAVGWAIPGSSSWTMDGIEAMSWVAEERGLGGARTLDGLAWDLSIEAVWEAWVSSFAAELSKQIGMVSSPFQSARRPLRWAGQVRSMGALMPDVELRSAEKTIWIDAKYKAHMELLRRKGWDGLSEEIRDAHRADLHQALAYASLADTPQVDTILIYPQIIDDKRPIATVASITSGRRRVRLILASLPFGFHSPEQRETSIGMFREVLAA
jgi:hypothetical protein